MGLPIMMIMINRRFIFPSNVELSDPSIRKGEEDIWVGVSFSMFSMFFHMTFFSSEYILKHTLNIALCSVSQSYESRKTRVKGNSCMSA